MLPTSPDTEFTIMGVAGVAPTLLHSARMPEIVSPDMTKLSATQRVALAFGVVIGPAADPQKAVVGDALVLGLQVSLPSG